MTDQKIKLFQHFIKSYSLTRPKHPVLEEAAQTKALTTSWLIQEAIKIIKQERKSDEYSLENFALLILQQRTNTQVINSAINLLKNRDPAARQLGVQLLRELPNKDALPDRFLKNIIQHLEKLVNTETDEEVLLWALSAIGWQPHPLAIEILLRFMHDQRIFIRRIVSNNLLNSCEKNQAISASVAEAFLVFANDPDDDIRWSIYYDIAEYPHCFISYQEIFIQLAKAAKEDINTTVQEQAKKAYNALDQL